MSFGEGICSFSPGAFANKVQKPCVHYPRLARILSDPLLALGEGNTMAPGSCGTSSRSGQRDTRKQTPFCFSDRTLPSLPGDPVVNADFARKRVNSGLQPRRAPSSDGACSFFGTISDQLLTQEVAS